MPSQEVKGSSALIELATKDVVITKLVDALTKANEKLFELHERTAEAQDRMMELLETLVEMHGNQHQGPPQPLRSYCGCDAYDDYDDDDDDYDDDSEMTPLEKRVAEILQSGLDSMSEKEFRARYCDKDGRFVNPTPQTPCQYTGDGTTQEMPTAWLNLFLGNPECQNTGDAKSQDCPDPSCEVPPGQQHCPRSECPGRPAVWPDEKCPLPDCPNPYIDPECQREDCPFNPPRTSE